MKNQEYHFAGGHSAVKGCKWLHDALVKGKKCYKNAFYGIESHRCIQCTPVATYCNMGCIFCWRIMPDEKENLPAKWDEAADVVEWIIAEHLRIVSGYGGNKRVSKGMWEEAKNPKHAAISLTGEVMFYPHMSELIEEFWRRGMTTFLVTNGTLPKQIAELERLPTQFYVSLNAPNEEVYRRICAPKYQRAWVNFNETLEILNSMPTRRVLRMTLVKGHNMLDAAGYAKLIEKALPEYVEVKSFVYVGGARDPRRGLSLNNMPTHDEIRAFAKELAEVCGYIVSAEYEPSRVVLLCRDKKSDRGRILNIRADS
ncbi:MAG: 4-demethylwyosine synthase TYW1 [Candidatus Micrarchaeia archaeon]